MNKFSDILRLYEKEYEQYFNLDEELAQRKSFSIIRWVLLFLLFTILLIVTINKYRLGLCWLLPGFVYMTHFSRYLVEYGSSLQIKSMQDVFNSLDSTQLEIEKIKHDMDYKSFSNKEKKDKVFQLKVLSLELDYLLKGTISLFYIAQGVFVVLYCLGYLINDKLAHSNNYLAISLAAFVLYQTLVIAIIYLDRKDNKIRKIKHNINKLAIILK